MMRSRAKCALAAVALALAAEPAAAQAPAFTPRDESPEDYPAADGREQTFYACTPCHGFKIVAQQAQTRERWNDTLDWMTQRHAMPRPSDNDRKVLLDYLAAAFPARGPRGWQNPFQRGDRRPRKGLTVVRDARSTSLARTLAFPERETALGP